MNSTKESSLETNKKVVSREKKMKNSKGIWKKAFMLTLMGGLAFWLANFAISRTPIAAEYRAAMSISYYPMLIKSLIGGLIIGLLVSYPLLRFFDRFPVKNPILKSVILSSIVLVIVTILLGGPSSFYATGNTLRYFIIGTTFNLIRILALGIVVGYGCKRHYSGDDPSIYTAEFSRGIGK